MEPKKEKSMNLACLKKQQHWRAELFEVECERTGGLATTWDDIMGMHLEREGGRG